jgi:CRP/FNR family cyclic AMP-dependent transcriptional regulator
MAARPQPRVDHENQPAAFVAPADAIVDQDAVTADTDVPGPAARSLRVVGGRHQERAAPLLDVDPDLGHFLTEGQAHEAHRRMIVRLRRLKTGRWAAGLTGVMDPGHLGLLLLDGVVMREVLTTDVAATELLGAGDVVRPWQLVEETPLLRAQVRWSVLCEARVAVLDRRVAQQLTAFPEVMSVLMERMAGRSRRLAIAQAIAQINRVDRRLLALFWHLAERWGRVTPEGIMVPLTLSHRLLGQLVGAQRPTVSTALGELAAQGTILRRADHSWLLPGTPPDELDPRVTPFIPPRRRFVAREALIEPALVEAAR